jgi:hypothetical protein
MSTNEKNLSRLEPVDLREIWVNESSEFTPWLAKEENLKLLGDTIGVDLELEAIEKEIGPYRADILCKDTATNDWVLIENQLENTDHTHLGQIITYAAGLKAKTIVWIAKRFTDEHLAALDWLNELVGNRLAIFGIEIELWRIGGSPIAPKFNIVSQPNEELERVTEFAEGELTDTKILQQDYWVALRKLLQDRKSIVKPHKPLPQHWTGFAIGRSNFELRAAINSQKNFIRLRLVCLGPNAKMHFALLNNQKGAIEQEIGCDLEWEELPNRKQARIVLVKPNVDPTKREEWPSQHQWMAEKLEAFYKAFSGRIKELDVEESEHLDNE